MRVDRDLHLRQCGFIAIGGVCVSGPHGHLVLGNPVEMTQDPVGDGYHVLPRDLIRVPDVAWIARVQKEVLVILEGGGHGLVLEWVHVRFLRRGPDESDRAAAPQDWRVRWVGYI